MPEGDRIVSKWCYHFSRHGTTGPKHGMDREHMDSPRYSESSLCIRYVKCICSGLLVATEVGCTYIQNKANRLSYTNVHKFHSINQPTKLFSTTSSRTTAPKPDMRPGGICILIRATKSKYPPMHQSPNTPPPILLSSPLLLMVMRHTENALSLLKRFIPLA